MIRYLILFIILFFSHIKLFAYEVETHAAITREAYKRSIVESQNLFDDLGIGDKNSNLGNVYFDYDEDRVIQRKARRYENIKIKRLGINPFLPAGWLMRGAIREDDCIVCGNPPFDNNPVNAIRPLNHFYDPVYNKPLLGDTAPNWALGTFDAFNAPIKDNRHINHFTNFDAQTAMTRALSGQYTNEQNEIVYLSLDERRIYWATLFRTLGNIVHLIQDMGQPQHTRLDAHNKNLNGEESVVYEKYTNARVLNDDYICFVTNTILTKDKIPNVNYALNYGGNYKDYQLPKFQIYGDYFSTEPGGNVAVGKGLADYSNRGYFTSGTNKGSVRSKRYPSPENKPLAIIGDPITENCIGNPNLKYNLYYGDVLDSLDPSANSNIPLTARSMWDTQNNDTNVSKFTFTLKNYNAMADQLIPRAVAYSAGVINFFFRGRVEVEISNNTGVTAQLNVKNVSYENNVIAQGEFRLFYDATDGDRKEITINNDSGIVGTSLAINAIHTIEFEVPADIDYSKKNPIVLVYSGLIGQEQGVIGKVFSILESSGFVVSPDFVLSDGKYGSRLLTNDNGQWAVSTDTGFVAGNIDWKGWYVNGKPTQALTWFGPQARYFPGGGFDTKIYKGGDIYAVAPGLVLGAALNKDSNDNEWIIAIVQNSFGDRVYKRPNKRSTSSALFEPQTNPEGWRLIGDIAPIDNAEYIDTPWFFNGNGTAAQTMRKVSGNRRRMRLLININNNSAVMTNLGNIDSEGLRTEDSTGTVRTTSGEPQPTESDLCISGTESMTGFYEIKDSYKYTKRQSNENIVAVDYLDNAEIVATMLLVGSEDVTSTRVNRTEYSVQCEEPNKFTPESGATKVDEHEDATISRKFEYLLDIRGDAITLYSSSENNIWSIYNNYTDDTYRASYTGNEDDLYPRLAYLDLRDKTNVMSSMLQSANASGNTTDKGTPNWVSGGYSEEWSFDIDAPGLTRQEVVNQYSRTINGFLDPYPRIDLNAKPYRRTSGERVPEVDYYYGYDASWVTDLDGNFFMTMEKLFGQTFRTYPGYINYLSNGNLNQIFGQDISNSSFYPAGIK